jgi:Xaa-Pro aminopeptidase
MDNDPLAKIEYQIQALNRHLYQVQMAISFTEFQMFQDFAVTARPADGPPRLAYLRQVLLKRGLDGFLVPRSDAHQGEYVADHDARLAWLTGFSGSAGFAIVLSDQAGVFIDGRYRLQVREQVDLSVFTPVNWPENKPGPWLIDALHGKAAKIGFDAWLHTEAEISAIRDALIHTRISLVNVDNPIDAIWDDQPMPPEGRIFVYPDSLAGQSSASKRMELAVGLKAAGQKAVILTLPDSINWLLNIRGEDIPRVPVAHGFAILHDSGRVDFFTKAKPESDVMAHLGPDVRLAPQDDFIQALSELSGTVRVDKTSAPIVVAQLLECAGAKVVWDRDPCILPKARKNTAEIDGTAEAHLRDGAAMVEFLCWLDQELPKGQLSETAIVRSLEGFRRASNALKDISFDTICGSGPNGAVMHYRVTTETDRQVRPGELIVIDSGAQYIDGTTDITRTVGMGEVGLEERQAFTRVLQGMIAISRARFPKGVAGAHLDALARYPLWLAGQDYDHGTGHGVGVYLSVHEGPVRLSRVSDLPLEPGMILSNEPGYYRDGAFGIRIENLIVVQEAVALVGADDRKMLDFRTLTYVPIDRRLIVVDMLSTGERDWLNTYHMATYNFLETRVSDLARIWLKAATDSL